MKILFQNNQSVYNPGSDPFNLPSDEVIGLFEDMLNSGLSIRVKATGRSMAPFLHGIEILTIKKVPSYSLHIGDLIFLKTQYGSSLIHRIVRKSCKEKVFVFQTKGDALMSLDTPVPESDVLGKVYRIEKTISDDTLKDIDMESFLWRSIGYVSAVINLGKSKIYHYLMRSSFCSSLRFFRK